jgi:hypothetical protein
VVVVVCSSSYSTVPSGIPEERKQKKGETRGRRKEMKIVGETRGVQGGDAVLVFFRRERR